ncbi:MAG: putative OB-fold protein [Myxococcota bacterium]|jgi:uncharacterized OB-fold protein
MPSEEPYLAAFTLEYAYKRSLGPTLSRFFTGLRDGILLGARTDGGRVLAPPTEYDPLTGRDITDLVEVGPGGTVTTWTWCAQPPPPCPLTTPFAWALVHLDGADTAMLHAVVAPQDTMHTGMRVRARWADARSGSLWDLTFEPEPAT